MSEAGETEEGSVGVGDVRDGWAEGAEEKVEMCFCEEVWVCGGVERGGNWSRMF